MSSAFNDTLGAILLGDCAPLGIRHSPTSPYHSCAVFLFGIKFHKLCGVKNGSLAQILAATASDTLVRGIFATRIWSLSRNVLLVMIIGSLSLVYLGFTILMIIDSKKVQHIMWLLYVSLATAVAADACIAIFLCWQLYNKKTSFKRFTINTGLVMTLASTSVFIFFVLQPDNFIYIGVFFVTSKLYNNSLLASLNARDYVRNQLKSVMMVANFGVPPFSLSTTQSNTNSADQANRWAYDDINLKSSLVP
ncbi:hypothetical protein Clacol_007901 [Clathrus columnatus]|uniref:DUF6534 domain-containing protein n=1 Tax=Clathrus columnatus TaxID=1419009 RepID=A0AAV5AP01_9AGAM|nr:hypothetical protein Clacol_007901 [Clathrus columnatus]